MNTFIIETSEGVRNNYDFDGVIFNLCTELQRVKAKSLTVPIQKSKTAGCMPPNVYNDIKKNTRSFKGFSLNQSDSLKWNSSGFGGGCDYSEKYKTLLNGNHELAMVLVNEIQAKIVELNKLVKDIKPDAVHQANFYVTWKDK